MTRSLTRVLILLVLALICTSLTASGQSAAEADASLSISAPATVPAGSAFDVVVTSTNQSDESPLVLTLLGGYGPRLYAEKLAQGVATFHIPETESRIAGLVTAVVQHSSGLSRTSFVIAPGPAVEPVKPLIGARSIVADGEHWSMVVAIPFDQFGNPIEEGSVIRIASVHPGGVTDDRDVETSHLLAWRRVVSGTVAGRTTVSVSTGDAVGPVGVIEEVAGWPVSFALSANPTEIPADGQGEVILKTGTIVDQFGNEMPDGTLVTFVANSAAGEIRIPAVTIGGVATAPLRASSVETTVTVSAMIFDVMSAPVQVHFSAGPAVGTFPVTARVDSTAGLLVVDAGPIVGALQEYVPDGTAVEVVVGNGDREVLVLSKASMGHATATIRLVDLASGSHTVVVTSGSGSGQTTVDVPESTASAATSGGESDTAAPAPVSSPQS